MRQRRAHTHLVFALVACAAACACSAPFDYSGRLSAWAEFLDQDELEPSLTFAGEHALNVNLAMVDGREGKDYLETACRASEQHDVPLRLWPLLHEDAGYWANQTNADLFVEHALDMARWSEELCPRVRVLVVDLEMPYDRMQELRELYSNEATELELFGFLLEDLDTSAFYQAILRFTDLIDELHSRDWRVEASTLPMIADDFEDGDESLANLLWTPVERVPWDQISIQVYRSQFDANYQVQAASGAVTHFTSGLVSSYVETMVDRFGDVAAVDLGTTAAGVIGSGGMDAPEELQSDIAAALAAGLDPGRIAIFALEGLVDREQAEAWTRVPEPKAAPEDQATTDVRARFRGIDSLME